MDGHVVEVRFSSVVVSNCGSSSLGFSSLLDDFEVELVFLAAGVFLGRFGAIPFAGGRPRLFLGAAIGVDSDSEADVGSTGVDGTSDVTSVVTYEVGVSGTPVTCSDDVISSPPRCVPGSTPTPVSLPSLSESSL